MASRESRTRPSSRILLVRPKLDAQIPRMGITHHRSVPSFNNANHGNSLCLAKQIHSKRLKARSESVWLIYGEAAPIVVALHERLIQERAGAYLRRVPVDD